ncbi:PaaI family thioesterase [Kibdelosporangium aridum]|uniref:PaaI family thioesterase n=1 Tax=Kibdelosporangium aridum TaxID=2030 RepID=UPI0005268EA7
MTAVAGEPIELPWLDFPRFRCFGCSPANPIGLALKFHRTESGEVAARTTFSAEYASYPGIVHGGIVNVLVDEVMGDMIAIEHGLLAFSITLRTTMLLPLRTGTEYLTTARVTSTGNGKIRAEADVTGPDGEVHMMASAVYQPIRSEQARELMGIGDDEFEQIKHYFDHQIGQS